MLLSSNLRERIRGITPWWGKAALKLGFAQIPYPILRALALAGHGGMRKPAWALATFRRHFNNVDFRNKCGGFNMLELGPGDSLFSAIIARACGAGSITLLDVQSFANTDLKLYRNMSRFLKDQGLDAPDLFGARSLNDVLDACNARYETQGLASLRKLPDACFDFIFSNSVLQHVRRDEIAETLRELRRVVHARGATIHSVDFRDTMGQSLHHLRFSERTWESNWFRSAGFYTNRLRLSQLMQMASDTGFEPELDEVNRWPTIPLARGKLAPAYQAVSDEDLLIATVRIILRPSQIDPSATLETAPANVRSAAAVGA
jgi:hypothetical protein